MNPPKKRRRLQKRTTVNIMLYVGVLAMVMVTYYDYRARQPAELQPSTIESAEVDAIGLHRPGYRSIILEKQAPGDWLITAPIERRAQSTRVEALLSMIALDIDTSYRASELNAGELGLGTPAATVHFVRGGQTVQALLGGLGPNNQRRYLQIGQQVWLSDDIFLPLLNGGLSAFADLRLLPESATPVTIASGELDDATIAAWKSGGAAAVLPLDELPAGDAAELVLTMSNGNKEHWTLQATGEQYALIPPQTSYALIVTKAQMTTLGLQP